ncbi:MAG: hypothetical protein EXS08_08375 [Planctomycetes bacterium]|nr:hypothetical protein [Planctomycetota bacterium]
MNVRAFVPFLVLLSACSHGAHTTHSTQTTVAGDNGTALVIDGVTIQFTDVRYSMRQTLLNGVPSPRIETIEGRPFGVRDGVFFIGDVEYGAVSSGTTVKVSAEGVFVGDEKRGVVPAAKGEK